MEQLTQQVLIELSVSILFYFTIGSFGAFLKDLHKMLSEEIERIHIGSILIGGGVSTFTCLFIQDYLDGRLGLNSMVFLAFVLGVLGFEIFGNANLNRVLKFLKYLNKYRKGFLGFLEYMKHNGDKEDSKESESEVKNKTSKKDEKKRKKKKE